MNLTVDLKAIDLVNAEQVLLQAQREAEVAAQEKYEQIGQRDLCGFAWVTVYNVRSTTKLGKLLVKHGFSKAYGGGLQLWDPAKYPTQCISIKEAGALAYANVLSVELGLKAYVGSKED